MTRHWANDLARYFEPGQLQQDPDVVEAYSRDQASLAPSGRAGALLHAKTNRDIVEALKFANSRRIPVVTRAAGTGLAGGANAIEDCLILSVAGLNKIHSIDKLTRTAVVQAGVLNGKLAKEANKLGLYYAPDPSSRDISTIGGNIATNAGGACCLKYGVTGDHVRGISAVTADGQIIFTGSTAKKNVAGLDLTSLLIGSEGTLAVIVEATVQLLNKPRPPATLAAFFTSVQEAASAILAMEAADLSLVEMMDKTTIGAVEAMTHMDLDTTAAAMVLVQSDAVDAASIMGTCEKVCQNHGATEVFSTDDEEEGRLLLVARHLAYPALEKLGTTLLDDVAVPKPALPEMFRRCQQAADNHQVVIGTFGHAGDGNLHPTIIFDSQITGSKRAAFAAFDEIVRAALDLGGTITGEHGIGNLKHGYLSQMLGDRERLLMSQIKEVFDPNNILNPGKGL